MKTVVLTGMPASGKTAVAKIIAKNLNIDYIDIDSIIEKIENRTISEIFKTDGEAYFRKIEEETIISVFKPQNQIISLGGGAFENGRIREFLLNKAKVVYLKTSPQKIYERTKNDNTRPLLLNNSYEKIEELLKLREKNYSKAHKTIHTDSKTPEEISLEIIND